MDVNRRLFCSKPFKWFEIFRWDDDMGQVYMCCPGWMDTPIGHLGHQPVGEIWNGERAQEIRRSILDGSFRYCIRSRCPYLQTVSGPVEYTDEITDEDLTLVIEKNLTVLPYGPRAINCSYDRSCNLSCPSCRTEMIVETRYKQQILLIQERIRKEALKDAHLLYITGSGDPFGSPFFRNWLRSIDTRDMPHLNQIFLHTNAQLWTPGMWNTIMEDVRALVKNVEISIDAADSKTYSINRKNGNFERLLENLEFISQLRQNGPLQSVTISMVVQENNFLQMPDFVQLGKGFNFDRVFFSQLINWGTFTEEEFNARAIHLSAHPRHTEFVNLLKNRIFHEPIVHLGNVKELENVQE